MGYACPVCGTPQADERHLADHLAVTAMTHGDEHEDWLDDHVLDWTDHTPPELGAVVAEEAVETDYPQVFEDTTRPSGHDHGHDPDAQRLEDHLASEGRRGPRASGRGDLSGDEAGILAEAREMTREMMGADGEADGGENDERTAREDAAADSDEESTDGDGSGSDADAGAGDENT